MQRHSGTIPAVLVILSLFGLFIGWNLRPETAATPETTASAVASTAVPTAVATVVVPATATATAVVIDAEATVQAVFAQDAQAFETQLTALALQLATVERQLTVVAGRSETVAVQPEATAVPVVPTVVQPEATAVPVVPTAVPVAATAVPVVPTATNPPAVVLIDAGRAGQAALRYLGSSEQPRSINLISKGSQPVYEIIVERGSIFVDAVSGAVIGSTVPPTATAAAQPISAQRAAQIAQAYLGGGQVVSIERTVERGADVYVVEFRNGSEVYVDAVRGIVVYAEVETDGDDGDDGDDDHEESRDDDDDD